MGFRSIGRFLGINNVSVLNWIRSFGKEIQELHSESQEIGIIEVDGMLSFLGSKKYCWIRIAVDRYGKRFINFVIGGRGNETARKFWETVKQHKMEYIASDYWKPYKHIILKEKHIQTKAETFTIEGYNSLYSHFLTRIRRKSKCYSKKVEMLKISILPLMHHRNGSLYIFN